MMTIDDVLKEIGEQLEWRGPTGRHLGHVAITRESTQLLYDWAKERRDAELAEYETLDPDQGHAG